MALELAGVKLIAQDQSAYIADMKSASKATDAFVDGTEHGGGRVSAAGQVMIGALRQIGTIAIDAFAQAAKATVAFIGDSIGLAGDFEQGMLNFQAVAGKDVDASGLEDFRDLFIDIGKRLPVSTMEVQQAAAEMVKGGIDPAIVAAGGLEQNIQFAAAAMEGDLVKAAEISSKILGGWAGVNATAAEKADFLTHATDMLTKAANASATDVEGLSRGIFQAQGIARTAGVSFDDLTTTLAELAPRFASSAEAGTSLKNMIARLQPTTDPAASAMEGLGLYSEETGSAFYDLQGNFVGFEKASQLLQESLIGLTKEQKAQALQIIFGNDAMGSAAALAELGAAGYQNMAEALASANGVADAAALKQQGFNTSLDNTKGSAEALQITIGSFLLPVLGDLLDNYVAPGINAVTAFADSFFKMAPAIMASDDPLQSFLNALKIAAPGLLDIIVAVEDAKDAFLAFATPIADVLIPAAQTLATFVGDNLEPILFGLATAITVAVVPALVAATGAFLAAAAPVVALVAAGALLYQAWQTDFLGIKTTVIQVWTDTLLPAFQGIQAWLAEKIPPAIKTLSQYWTGTLQPALKDVWAFIDTKILPVLGTLTDVFIAAAIIEVKALAAMWTNTLWPALKLVGSFISDVLWPIFKVLFEVEWAIASKAVEAMAGLWQKVLQPAFKSVGDYITGTVVPAFTDIGSYLDTTFGPALKGIKDWLDKVTGGFGGVSGAVQSVTKWLGDLATSISTLKLPSWLTPGSPTPFEIGLLGIGKALSTMPASLSAMQEGVSEVGDQIGDTFQDGDLVGILESLGEDAMGGFIHGIKSAWGGVKDIINSTADNIEDAFKDSFDAHSPAQRFVPIGASAVQGVMAGFASEWPSLIQQIGSLSGDLVDGMRDIGEQMQNAVADGFGATASIDRQIAKNLDAFKDVLPQYEQYTTGMLKQAQSEAEAFLDPAEGAKFFQMRSKQIMEYAKLQKDLADEQQAANDASAHQSEEMAKSDVLRAQFAAATTDEERDAIQKKLDISQQAQDADILARRAAMAATERLQAQMLLIARAQEAEVSQFNAREQSNPMQDIAAQIKQMIFDSGLAILDNPLIALLDGIANQLNQVVNTRADAYAHPPQMQYPPAATGSTTTSSTSISMPIYTNQSPAVLQQSWAIMQASMP